jgi:hypothetical protein
MIESAIKVNLLLVGYGRRLLADISDERMTEQPLPGVNHPAWILGHLAFSTDIALAALGAPKVLPAEWTPLYGPGSSPSASRTAYSSKDELVQTFEQGFDRVRQQAASAIQAQLAQASTHPRMTDALPTVQDGVAFLLTGHLGVHLGQLSTWRRMIGLPHLF